MLIVVEALMLCVVIFVLITQVILPAVRGRTLFPMFNVFTRMLKDKLEKGEKVLVKLRDGRIVEPEWYNEEGPEHEFFCYRQNGYFLIWENDGVSIVGQDFDIMESVEL